MHYLSPATTQYNDWVGTAAADTADEWSAMAEAAGLDADRWRVVAIEIGFSLGSLVVQVSCVDMSDLERGETIDEFVARRGGSLPVTRFLVDALGDEIGAVIDRAFKRLSVQLLDRYAAPEGRPLAVVEDVDLRPDE